MPYKNNRFFFLCQFNEAMETTLNSLTSLFQFPLVSCSSEMTFVFSAHLNVIWPFKPPRTKEFVVYTKFVTSVTTKNIDRNLRNSNRLRYCGKKRSIFIKYFKINFILLKMFLYYMENGLSCNWNREMPFRLFWEPFPTYLSTCRGHVG